MLDYNGIIIKCSLKATTRHNAPHLITLLCLTPDTFTHQGESLRINELINSSYDYYYNYNSNNITKWKVKYPVN